MQQSGLGRRRLRRIRCSLRFQSTWACPGCRSTRRSSSRRSSRTRRSFASSRSASDAVWLVDANVLIYTANEDAPQHRQSRGWIDAALHEAEPVGFSWVALLAFLPVATNSALLAHPLPAA